MTVWMRFGQPLEDVIEDYGRIFDAWQAGGVEAVVVGRLFFANSSGEPMSISAFDPDPAIYKDLGVEPPAAPKEKLAEKRNQLTKALQSAKDRGLEIYVFCPDAGQGPGGDGHALVDELSLNARVARVSDVMQAFPMVDGGVMDGPELGYEIAPEHRSDIFQDMPDTLRDGASAMGFDFEVLKSARDRFRNRLTNLRACDIDLRADGGLLGAYELFDSDPEIAMWFTFRRQLLTQYYRRQAEALRKIPRSVRIGVGSRLPCFAPLNGADLKFNATEYAFILPKLYFFHRGFDGFYGTVGRYIQTLTQWNPGLSDTHALKVVEALFGIRLPWIKTRFDLELGFPPEFLEFVQTEVRRMLSAASSPQDVVPWVEAGREPHHGDPITAGDLHRYLCASREAGLERFLYHSHTHLSESEWAVISTLCGQEWHTGKSDYIPPDNMAWESHSKR